MAEKAFNEKIFGAQTNAGFGFALDATGKAPLIAKRIFASYADAEGYALDDKDSAVPGLMLTVIADSDPLKNGLYFVKAQDGTDNVEGLVGPFATVADVQNATPTIEYDKEITDAATDDKAPSTKAVKTYVDGVKAAIDTITDQLSDKISKVENWKLSVIIKENATEPNFGLTEISYNTIYLVPEEDTSGDGNNVYKEYIYVNDGGTNKWELLGEVPAVTDLSGVEGRISTLEEGLAAVNTEITDIKKTLNDIATVGGEPNKINSISLNGTVLAPSDDENKRVTFPMASTEADGAMTKEHYAKLESIGAIENTDIEKIVNPDA